MIERIRTFLEYHSNDSLERLKEKLSNSEINIKIEGLGKYIIEFAIIASATFFGSTLGSLIGKGIMNAGRISKIKKAIAILLS